MKIQNNDLKTQGVAFTGHKKTLNKSGYIQQDFFYEYDKNKYDCAVELYNIKKDSHGNFSLQDDKEPAAVFPMEEKGSISINMSDYPQIDPALGFAYRFKLTDKNTQKTSYAFDNGTVIGIFNNTEDVNNKYNVILNNRAIINKNGPMQLIMPDEYYPGVEKSENNQPKLNESLRTKALCAVRTHANKLGGNLYGIIKRLPELEKEGITRIVGTPFTKDTISSHLYWTENAFQICPNLGSEEDFKTMQKELFKHGLNWISDAALVNEGFGGIHFSELLRKGDDSFSKNMFRADEKISIGILPDNCEYTRMKFINTPFKIIQSDNNEKNIKKVNPDYDPSKPTFIQFYDDRLASTEQKLSSSPSKMTTYENKNTDNIYDITKHDDAVYPFPIEVDPYKLDKNVSTIIKEKGVLNLGDVDTIEKVTDFGNFNVVRKSKAGGLEVWDGNVDIAKLNFYKNVNDNDKFSNLPQEEREEAIKDFERGTLAVRDYALSSGKYWTQLTEDTIMAYASQLFEGVEDSPQGYMNAIKNLVNEGNLPKYTLDVVDEEIINEVLTDNYHLKRLDDADMRADINPEGDNNTYQLSDYILRKSMDVPLETMPFATNLLEILTSPYIAKKANTDKELTISRYDLSKAGNQNLPKKYSKTYNQTENIYKNGIVPLIKEMIKDIPGITDETGIVTDYGKYVLSEIVPELTKLIIVKSISPKSTVKLYNKGELDFSDINSEEITMQSIGIPYSGKDSEEEAQIVINTIKKGINKMSNSDITKKINTAMKKRFGNRRTNDFKIAEMIIDRTESGLGWRIDAAKDIATLDAVRTNVYNMNNAWDNVVDFWTLFNQSILEINPHAYTTAEITDLVDLIPKDNGKTDGAKYRNDADAERKFLEATGITAVANYNYFFSLPPELFSNYSLENGSKSWMSEQGKNFELRKKFDEGWNNTNPGFLFQSPDDGIVNSYTFSGNHDKPRVMHCLSLNMNLFYSDFSKPEDRKVAAEVLQKEEKDIDYDKVNAKAIAMGARLNDAFENSINKLNINANEKDRLKEEIKEAVKNLAQGEFKGSKFDAEAFGTRPFEIAIKSVFEQAEYSNGSKIPNKKTLEAKTLENILTPAYDRYYSIYKLLTVIPGSPTDFAGDRVGSTGSETKAKNYNQQNRNVIRWEWLENNDYKFIYDAYVNCNKIANLRKRPELSALNDGATVTLPIPTEGDNEVNSNEKIQAILRYNDNSTVLSIHDSSGANSDFKERMNRKTTKTSIGENTFNRIILNPEHANAKQGLKYGMPVGTKFKNERSNDNSVYEVALMNKNGQEYYYLKRIKNGKEVPIEITPEDYNTLILYKVTENEQTNQTKDRNINTNKNQQTAAATYTEEHQPKETSGASQKKHKLDVVDTSVKPSKKQQKTTKKSLLGNMMKTVLHRKK